MDLTRGDIIIPDGLYCYSLQVNKVTPWYNGDKDDSLSGAWWKQGYHHVECTRYDLDSEKNKPVFENPSRMHIRILKQIGPVKYIDDNGDTLTRYDSQLRMTFN